MANFHDKIVLNKYLLSLFGIDGIGTKIVSKDGVEIFRELKFSVSEGYTEEGNTRFLQQLKAHLYLTEHITESMLQQYDENIVRYTHEISDGRDELIVWKYFQYLSLLFTEIYLDKYFTNKKQLQYELNAFVKLFNQKQIEALGGRRLRRGESVFQAQPFTEYDLNKLALWNATGSGKTLLMHINIKQYLHYAKKHTQGHQSKILLITPNEPLSIQHLKDFHLSGIPANIFNKNQPGIFSGKEVEIIEISKLSEDTKEKTVAVDSFETHNLVLVDEGHGGMSGDQWKRFRDQLSKTGFAFEYSATFGQAINSTADRGKKEALTQEYAKSIIFDYSYKYFYEDGYGKDYRILNLKDDALDFKNKYLTANLLSYYQQLLIFKNRPDIVARFRLFKPLWVFVGSSVNAVRTENRRETSDVLDIVHFLTDFLKHKDDYIECISLILNNKAGLLDSKGFSIFEGSFFYLEELGLSPEEIFEDINREVFHNHNIGSNLYLDNLKGATGELGLRVGATDKYFGVINVGDEKKLYDLAIKNGILGTEKDFSESLFVQINQAQPRQQINLLIGSKKFTEGWSSWRVSSMGLMNIGKSEGSQIIQLFGRGVRLQGFDFSLKRSTGLDEFQKPDDLRTIRKLLRPLETLQIFGVRANYMERFKELLEEEGLPSNAGDWVTITVPALRKVDVQSLDLKMIQVMETENFKKREILKLDLNTDIFRSKQVEVDWYPKIDALESARMNKVGATKEVCYLEKRHHTILNWTQIYFEIQTFKASKGYSNLEINLEKLKEIALSNAWYTAYIPADKLEFSSFKNVSVWQEITTVLLKKYIEQFYLYHKNKFNANHIETRKLTDTDENLILQYDIRLNKNEDVSQLEERFNALVKGVTSDTFKTLRIANQVEAFDHLLHLYKPLIYVGKGYEGTLQVFPLPLNETETQFLKDFERQIPKLKQDLCLGDIFVLRNQSRRGSGFFAEGNNFYPDFILWIKKDEKQYLTFIDPKGITRSNGISDAKIQFHRYLAETVQPKINKQNLILNSFIISNTKWIEVNWKESLSLADFNNNNVFFQQDQHADYIQQVLKRILN